MRLALVLTLAILGAGPPRSGATTFVRPPEMEHQIRFWRDVFTLYSQDQVLIHDTVDLDKVYAVVDLRPYANAGYGSIEIERIRRDSTDGELARIRALLLRLQGGASRDS